MTSIVAEWWRYVDEAHMHAFRRIVRADNLLVFGIDLLYAVVDCNSFLLCQLWGVDGRPEARGVTPCSVHVKEMYVSSNVKIEISRLINVVGIKNVIKSSREVILERFVYALLRRFDGLAALPCAIRINIVVEPIVCLQFWLIDAVDGDVEKIHVIAADRHGDKSGTSSL